MFALRSLLIVMYILLWILKDFEGNNGILGQGMGIGDDTRKGVLSDTKNTQSYKYLPFPLSA